MGDSEGEEQICKTACHPFIIAARVVIMTREKCVLKAEKIVPDKPLGKADTF